MEIRRRLGGAITTNFPAIQHWSYKQLMRRSILSFALVLCALPHVGCLTAQSRAARLQEAASNLNMATRFGRLDIASELVDDKSQPDFTKHHAGWGRGVRLVDLELQGMQLKDKDNAVVFVTVGWQRPDEQELRVTQLVQTWGFGPKGWKLTREERAGGDIGLLGEPITVVRPETQGDVQFRSLTIR